MPSNSCTGFAGEEKDAGEGARHACAGLKDVGVVFLFGFIEPHGVFPN